GSETALMLISKRLSIFFCAVFVFVLRAATADVSLGSFYDSFPLTLSSGHRTEIAGPVFYSEMNDTQKTIAVPPLFSWVRDPSVESEEFDFCYPLLSYDRFELLGLDTR